MVAGACGHHGQPASKAQVKASLEAGTAAGLPFLRKLTSGMLVYRDRAH